MRRGTPLRRGTPFKEELRYLIGASPQTPGFIAFGQSGRFDLPRVEGCGPYNRITRQEDRATQGCDPSAEPGPEWTAAFGPPPDS